MLDHYGLQDGSSLPDVYRASDHFDVFFYGLQAHLNQKVKGIAGRELAYPFYEATEESITEEDPCKALK